MYVFGYTANSGVKVFGPLPLVTVEVDGFQSLTDDNWALVDMQINHQEILDVRQCFNNTAFLFSLGNDLSHGTIDLTFMVFLSAEGCKSDEVFLSLSNGIETYKALRVSQSQSTLQMTIGNLSMFGWLKGMRAYGFDPSRGVCYVSISFLAKME